MLRTDARPKFAIIILILWAAAVIISLIGKATDNEDLVNFAEIVILAAAGFGAGCALNVLAKMLKKRKRRKSFLRIALATMVQNIVASNTSKQKQELSMWMEMVTLL